MYHPPMRFLLKLVGSIVLLVLVAGGIIAATHTDDVRRNLEHEGGREIAKDLMDQYDFLVKNGGSKMDLCAHAGAVALAYMQANDEINYKQWKSHQKRDCAAAGMPTD